MMSRYEHRRYTPPPILVADHVLGPATAPIIILEYGCYCCPREAEVFAIIQAVKKTYSDQVAFVYRHFPLVVSYPTAFLAAEAAEAAAAQGRFWRMHSYLAEHARCYTRGDLLQIALDLGLDTQALSGDLASHVHADLVKGHFHSAVNSNVRRVPTVFVNGVPCGDPITVEGLRGMIQKAGARAA